VPRQCGARQQDSAEDDEKGADEQNERDRNDDNFGAFVTPLLVFARGAVLRGAGMLRRRESVRAQNRALSPK
jgi:hypothetical protein